MIKVSLIGCGRWGMKILQTLIRMKGVRVVSCCDANRSRLTHIRQKYRYIRTTRRYEEICAQPDADAVVIATPTDTHYIMARTALDASKHVLVEKPLTTSSDEAKDLIILAQEKHRILMVDHTFAYNPAITLIQDIVKKNVLGELYAVEMSWVNLDTIGPSTNVVWDLAPHPLSILLMIQESIPLQIQYAEGNHRVNNITDDAHILFTYGNGAIVHIHLSWLYITKERKITLIGSKKALTYDDTTHPDYVELYDTHVKLKLKGHYRSTLSPVTVEQRMGKKQVRIVENKPPLQRACAHFLACIRTGTTPNTDGGAGLRVVELIETILRTGS